MPLPPALDEQLTDQLRHRLTGSQPQRRGRASGNTLKRQARRLGGRVLRRAEAVGLLRARQAAHQANVRLDGVEHVLGDLRRDAVTRELDREQTLASAERLDSLSKDVEALTVNQESLKRELRALQKTIDDLGWAIAPAAGLEGAQVRLAELRERVNGLDRRLRALAAPTAATPSANAGASGTAQSATSESTSKPEPASGPESALFDYVGFEARFRGDPKSVSTTLWERYGERLAAHAPVVDLGCGRAELLAQLKARGVAAKGIDTDPSMVLEARDSGLDVEQADALRWLESQPEGSIGSLIATHLVEHLQLDDLVRLLELAVSRLVPGGIFIAETPNPQSLIVLGNSYVLDPTHVRPVHPSLLTFLCEGAGFRDVRLEFYAPAEGYHLRPIDAPDAPHWVADINSAFSQLNSVLFGAQDYAAIATTPTNDGTEV
jgi:SAM-dependent methyltransferase